MSQLNVPAERRPARLRRLREGGDLCRGDEVRALAAELERGRRYARPLSLLCLAPERGTRDEHQALHAFVLHRSRNVDAVWCRRATLFVAMPETHRDDAELCARRWAAELADAAADSPTLVRPARTLRTRVACFPDDALTAGALLDQVAPTTRLPRPSDELRLRRVGVALEPPSAG